MLKLSLLVATLGLCVSACGSSGQSPAGFSSGGNGSGGASGSGGIGGNGGAGAGAGASSGGTSTGGGGTSGAGAGGASPDGGTDGSVGVDGGAGAGGAAGAYPIQHVIVIIKENHTFDNYFGSFPGADGTTTCKLSDGTTFPCPKAPDRTLRDLCHSHQCALTDWDQGKMDGWDRVSGSDQNGDHLAWAQYDESKIPNYWAYAKAFTLADHFFADELGPSFPGHMMYLAAQAGWSLGNPPTNYLKPYWGCDQPPSATVDVLDKGTCAVQSVFPCFKIPSIPDVLPSGVDWKFYGTNFYFFPEIWSMFDGIDGIRNNPAEWAKVVDVSEFTQDIQNGTLPNVVWLVDQDLNDEHPLVGSVCDGENWTVGYINQVMQSPYWKNTAIFFSMDDFGGWYDHVPPPRQYGCDKSHPYGLGFRLPLIVISPYAKPHYIFKEVSEQASIPRFIEKIFGAKTLSSMDPAAQDGQANDLMDAFDFGQPPLPPLVLKKRVCFL